MTTPSKLSTTVRRPRAHGPEARPSLGATPLHADASGDRPVWTEAGLPGSELSGRRVRVNPPCRHGCTKQGCWHRDCIVDQPREPESQTEQHADWQTDAFREIEDAFARFAGDPLDWD